MRWSTRLLATAPVAGVAAVAAHNLRQKHHALLRNFPVLGYGRYFLETIGPELRQYIIAGNDEERPFSRDQRRWVYASSKLQNNYFGFGSDNDMETTPGYAIVKHRIFTDIARPVPTGHAHAGDDAHLPSAKVMGQARGRAKAFRPTSVVNISAMSFGSLSNAAIEALNRGADRADCLHNTGEGSISPYHRKGGDLIYQIGTSYFGCRDDSGHFDVVRLKELMGTAPVKAIEIKLWQGAKPGLGGMLQVREKFGYEPGWGGLSDTQRAEIVAIMAIMAQISQPDTVSAGGA